MNEAFNWEAIGAIAEVLGAVAIFVSLIYVAVQIRQNTEQSARNVHATELVDSRLERIQKREQTSDRKEADA